jgi:tetratricopeptide (TPR) repeat protein
VWRWIAILGGAALALAPAPQASADPWSERCAALIAAESGAADARREAARCLVEAERFDDALARLEPLPAQDAEAALLRGMALYHKGRLAEAEAELARAEPQLGARAELHFYRGMIHLERSEWSAASSRLDRARRIDPAAVEPIASFHAARAWLAQAARLRAREALERVERDWPGTVWAAQSRRRLDLLDGRARAPARWLFVEAGIETDDNVVLRGAGVALPDEISDERDRRSVWLVHGGSELLRSGPWAGGAAFTYSGAAHLDLDEFDSHYPVATFWLDRQLEGIGTLRGSYDFGYGWVDGDAFLVAHDAALGLYRGSRWGTSGLVGRGYARDFRFAVEDEPDSAPGGVCPPGVARCGPIGVDEGHERNRDGLGYALGVEHSLALWRRRAQARVRVELERYDARGSEYSFTGESAAALLRAQLPLDLIGSLSGGWARRVHRHSSTFPDSVDVFPGFEFFLRGRDRRDETLRVDLELARPLGERLALVGRWSWRHNLSTADVFEYRQHVLGIHLRLGLGEAGP